MIETKTLSQVADEVGVPANTIKTWLHQLDFIPAEKDGSGRWRFPADAEEILRQIHALRLDGRSLNTVRRRLNDSSTTDKNDTLDELQDQRQELDEPRSTVTPEAIAEAVTAAVVQAIGAQTEQAEKYARAAHRIGELEATVKAIEAERERLAGELAEAKQRIMLLEAPKEELKARPWWKVWG